MKTFTQQTRDWTRQEVEAGRMTQEQADKFVERAFTTEQEQRQQTEERAVALDGFDC